jgi:Phospholipase_D-nuclease N-terminal
MWAGRRISFSIMIAYALGAIHGSSAAALVPIAVLAIGFVVFCLVDVFRSEQVRYLPRWAWALICIVSIPLGGIVYLVVGRQR